MFVSCLRTGRRAAIASLVAAMLTCPARADQPFDYFRNSFSVIGLKDYLRGTRITPDNRLQLADKATVQLRFGRQLNPLDRRQTKTLLDGWMPVVLLAAADGPVRYEFTFWATPLPNVEDWQKAFDWPTEGENFLNWITVKATNTGDRQAEAQVKVQQTGPSAVEASAFAWSLAPGQSARGVVRIPFWPVADAATFATADPKLWLKRTVDYWRSVMAKAARVEVPCRKATQALKAAHVCQLLVSDHGELHGGEGFYDEFFIRDGAYQVMELEEAGLTDAARKALEFYLTHQRPDGRFETQKNQFDANGQAVWTLWQFYKISGDRRWLERVYPQMRRAVDWTMKARRGGATAGLPRSAQADRGGNASTARRASSASGPFAGVLPAALADGEHLWDAKHHIVGYDIWNLRGLWCTADAARTLGKTDEAKQLSGELKLYRAAFDAAWKRTALPHFPPSWEKAGTHWGNTETLWPTQIFAPDDPRVIALIKEVRRNHGGGFVEGTIRWLGRKGAIHPYMGAYTTMASLVRGEHEQVVEDFYWYLLHSTATHAFPEGIYFKRRFAWSNTIPHPTGASNYALLLRHMLLHEQGDELHLLAAVPDWWLGDGKQIRIQRAPTHFGLTGLAVRGTAAGVEVRFDPPQRRPPGRIVLHLPKSRPLVGALEGVEVALRSDQRRRWDFPTLVKRYTEQAGPLFRPIPGLVKLPLQQPIARAECQMLDLTALVNTNQLTAPFGVESPGAYLFTGIPLGVQTAGGVPFEIIDPAKNDGRGLLVLDSPRAPKDRKWPRQVQIPLGQKGKRLFFLGNVHGWDPEDRGTGDWGAVAEYVIEYADGQKQTVPLITGRTADEWSAQPEADAVFAGLRGRPWHLNVLGVELRPVVVRRIIFRDLGTPAAPVLAAVTMEK